MRKIASANRGRGRWTEREREIQEATRDCPFQVIDCYLRSRNLSCPGTRWFRHCPPSRQTPTTGQENHCTCGHGHPA